jgi:hypothetical protein
MGKRRTRTPVACQTVAGPERDAVDVEAEAIGDDLGERRPGPLPQDDEEGREAKTIAHRLRTGLGRPLVKSE